MQREDPTSAGMPRGEPAGLNGKGAAVRETRTRQLRAELDALRTEVDRLHEERADLLERIAAAQAIDAERQARVADLRVALLMLRVRQPADRQALSAAQILRDSIPSAVAMALPAVESSNGHRTPVGPDGTGPRRPGPIVPGAAAPARHDGAGAAPKPRSERTPPPRDPPPRDDPPSRDDPGKQGAY